ncbi:YceI family protein [Porphyromonas canoris]|uniref:YceI family protein n=1 Tax=Porphyromonas canoris TaxID=36875 RepID=UPI0013786B2F|nr:YceI family protein [Porphyromonas canoris]
MKLRQIFFVAIFLFGLLSCSGNRQASRTSEAVPVEAMSDMASSVKSLAIDADGSDVKWTGYKPTGKHWGEVKIASGEIRIDPKTLLVLGGKIVLDMNSIEVDDLDDNSPDKVKLETHLKSEDFFNVKEFPEGLFEVTGSEPIEGSKAQMLSGNLTLKGETLNVSFRVTVTKGGEGEYEAMSETIVLDRTKWGINYASKNIFKDLKDNFIDDHFEVVLEIEAR